MCYNAGMKEKEQRPGRLTTNNVILEPHEYATINTLLAYGLDVELVRKSHTPHTKSADIIMMAMLWEMKSPNGKTTSCVKRAVRRATHQARNVIMDLRRIRVADATLITLLKQLFRELRSVRHLWVITKNGEIIKFKR